MKQPIYPSSLEFASSLMILLNLIFILGMVTWYLVRFLVKLLVVYAH